jgi:hypothetical protein
MLQYAKKEKNRDIKHPLLLYVLSLPSNWSAVACNEMKQLFTEFILDVDDHFEIIQHSQAAVLYCQNGEPVILAPEESYLVCDLGGETSNFALFEPVNKQGETHGIFKIQDNENVESVISFGSSHIDKKMKEYISRVIFNNDDTDIAKSGSIVGHLMDFFIHSVKVNCCSRHGE